MKTKTILIIAGSVAAIAGIVALIKRSNTLSNTGTSYTPVVTNLPAGGQTLQQPQNGNQAYTNQANVILRNSAKTDNAFLGIFGGNVGLTIPVSGTWIGTVVATLPDANGDVNPATSTVYNWYQIQLSSTQGINFSLPAGMILYVRSDMVTIK